jgi:hypothetical protein
VTAAYDRIVPGCYVIFDIRKPLTVSPGIADARRNPLLGYVRHGEAALVVATIDVATVETNNHWGIWNDEALVICSGGLLGWITSDGIRVVSAPPAKQVSTFLARLLRR